MKKRIFATLLALVMALGLTVTAAADLPEVNYIDPTKPADQQTQTCTNYEVVESSSSMVTWGEAGKTKWYVVNENVGINNYVTVNGDVKLILMDGKWLSVAGGLVGSGIGGYIYGIHLESGASLTVYGQSGGTGTLDAPDVGRTLYTAGNGITIEPSRAISIDLNFGSLTINGGHVMAGVTVNNAAICGLCNGPLIMNGGKLTATSYASPSTSMPIDNITIQSACCKWRTNDTGDYTAGLDIPTDQNQFTPNTRYYRYLEIVAGHEFGTWVDEVPATCTATGTKGHKDCTICKKHFDDKNKEITDLTLPVDPNNHAQAGVWSFDSRNHRMTYPCCNAATDAEPHRFNGRTCTVCGYAENPPIRRQNTTTAVEDTTDTAETTVVASPKTFDAGIAVYGAMAVASLMGMGYVGKKRV